MEIEKTEENFREIRQKIRNARTRQSENIKEWKDILAAACQLPRESALVVARQVISGMEEIFGNGNFLKFENGLALCDADMGREFIELGYKIMKKTCKESDAWKSKIIESYEKRFRLS